MDPWVEVAYLAKARKSNGSFVVKATAGLPFLLECGMHIDFVPPQTDMPRSGTVVEVKGLDARSAEVRFDTVTEASQVHELVGSHCLVDKSQLDSDVLETESGFWLGWKVIDEQFGVLGNVEDIVDNPGQSLLAVRRESTEGEGELLIPVVDEFIRDVDPTAAAIHVRVPAGLLEL